MKISVELDSNVIQSVNIISVVGSDPTVVLFRNSHGELVARKVKRFFSNGAQNEVSVAY